MMKKMRKIDIRPSSNVVDAADPEIMAAALGDPREYDRFSSSKLCRGDYAVVTELAIYFMRPRGGKPVRDPMCDGEVVMTHLLLGPNRGNGERKLMGGLIDPLTAKRVDEHPYDVPSPFYLIG